MSADLPETRHTAPRRAADAADGAANFAEGRSVYVADVAEYDLYRSMLYALGARAVSNKKVAGVDLIVHAGAAPKALREKYPGAALARASAVPPLFRRDVGGFGDFVRALQRRGFTVRSPSDEGSPELDFFDLPLVGSLHATLLRYLAASPFIRAFARNDTSSRGDAQPEYLPVEIPETGRTWYYAWRVDAWARVSAQRGEGDYPLEIKGPQLLAVLPEFWTRSTGLYFHEHPHIDSVNGLFIQAGVDARGRVEGAAISRVWT